VLKRLGEEPSPLAVAQHLCGDWVASLLRNTHALGRTGGPGTQGSLRDAAAQLWEEFSTADGEDQLAFRQERRYVARLVRKRRSTSQESPLKWRPDGSYLITGGLGDLGLSVARWMVEQGARRLILLGRTQLPPRSNWGSVETGTRLARQIAAIQELEALGASVHLPR
jgi:hypothetical protein